jgi:3-phenylpropionate/trans-cinnamate dioxygenase ferredoxin subunit
MGDYQRVASLSALGDDATLGVEVDGEPVCLARSNGQVYAIRDVCSHADVALSEGEVSDGLIECWLHGSQFSLETGKPTGLPAITPVPVYPVKIEGDDILIDLKPPSLT